MFFLQDDSPLYEWVLFEDTRKKADDIILVSDSDSVPSGYNEIQLTVTNNSVYTIVVHFRSIEIQKFEDGSWYDDFQWILVRDNGGTWEVRTYGYG